MLSVRSIVLAALALALAACSFERAGHEQACSSDADCASDARCYEGFCVTRDPSDTRCGQTGQLESCYEGEPARTMDVGSCKAGQRICFEGTYSECLGQVLPADEVCNGKDDDCDGDLDDLAAASTCDTQLQGACRKGTLRCRDGIEFCQPAYQSQTESCNAIDDDCDGVMDEVSAAVCYPVDATGCTRDVEGAWQCSGLCATGQSACDGTDATCRDAITPARELCTIGMSLAQDEDCDGEVDETCDCEDGRERECYAGPNGTRGRGACAAGTQVCVDAAWGECTGQVLPSPETCDNPDSDDDCNDVEDDVPELGASCIAPGARGECRNGVRACTAGAEPECVASEPGEEECDELDHDCDGDPRNSFDLSSDEMTCGACDVECSQAEMCCNGVCIEAASLQDDRENCGACGRACGMGEYCCQGDCLSSTGPTMAACACDSACGAKSCCGSNCRDLDKDKANCGACGRKCPAGQTCVDGVCGV